MTTTIEISNTSGLSSYLNLKKRVRETMTEGKMRVEQAVEREQARTKWEVGKLIYEHMVLNRKHAAYDEQVLKRLSADVDLSTRELRYYVEFARTYPLRPPAAQLSWSHYRELLAVNDAEKREELIRRASKEKWTIDKTRLEIKNLRLALTDFPAEEFLTPVQGELSTYQIVIAEAGPWKGQLAIDLGFANYYRPSEGLAFKANDIVRVLENNRLELVKDATGVDLYTYRAFVVEITDGDTIWMVVDLGFGFITKQHLRLRGIDAPEIISRDGQKAKKFVERALKNISSVIIASTKPDKYDRYLADVYYPAKTGEQFLNNRLLEVKLADRMGN